MGASSLETRAERFALRVKGAYWVALLIIAGMAMASYIMVQQMLAGHQMQGGVQALVNDQKVLSQRIVFLATAAERAVPVRKPALIESLRQSLDQFEANHDRLLGPESKFDQIALNGLLYGAPYHLDNYTEQLVNNARSLINSIEAWLTISGGQGDYLATHGWISFDGAIADRTLDGYTAINDLILRREARRLDNLRVIHRNLFWATIGIIVLVVVGILRPMSEWIQRGATDLVTARNAMAKLAAHDALTGANNRTFLDEHFDLLITAAHRRRERLAVVQIDLDRFKQVNDTLGHAAGDLVLIRTAERMRAACSESDLCIRLGGDEFVLLLSNAGTSEEIGSVVERVLEAINEPVRHEGTTIFPGASAGIAVFPVDAETAEDLLTHADLALYAAKRCGGGALSFFSGDLRLELDAGNQLKRDLHRAVNECAFSVHYQPQVTLRGGQVTGVEALARWTHPARGAVAPSEFIPIAERAGLMARVGRIVMEKAINDAAKWYREGVRFGRLAVNVSGMELREADFADHLFRTLADAGLPPEKLSLEIVESVILDDERTGLAAKLRAIRAAGIHLELDDFGTGYASLSHVNPKEIDRLKIDRRFVKEIDIDGDNAKIVRAIIDLARGLGISIIAEGAETAAELDALMAIGCDQVQGYSIAFPMPETQAREWIASRGLHKSEPLLSHDTAA